MVKPASMDQYDSTITKDCECVLVTLLRGLGPWKRSVFLIGGLTPRYLVRARPPEVPAHAGTGDVDIVIDLQLLTEINAYQALEANLRRMGFERAENEQGQKLSWRWRTKIETGATMILEFLADAPSIEGGRLQPLPTKGAVSALNIPHSSMVFDLHGAVDVTAELLGENGHATETVLYADLVSFTCLKAFAFDQRNERKDAHDLVYCIQYAAGGVDAVVAQFHTAMAGKHGSVIESALDILRRRFCDDGATEGYLRDGPVAVAKFELGENNEPADRENRALRQRTVSTLIQVLTERLAAPSGPTE